MNRPEVWDFFGGVSNVNYDPLASQPFSRQRSKNVSNMIHVCYWEVMYNYYCNYNYKFATLKTLNFIKSNDLQFKLSIDCLMKYNSRNMRSPLLRKIVKVNWRLIEVHSKLHFVCLFCGLQIWVFRFSICLQWNCCELIRTSNW